MTDFTPLSALAGGALIGLASALLLFTHNRVAGISGIAAGILPPWTSGNKLAVVVSGRTHHQRAAV